MQTGSQEALNHCRKSESQLLQNLKMRLKLVDGSIPLHLLKTSSLSAYLLKHCILCRLKQKYTLLIFHAIVSILRALLYIYCMNITLNQQRTMPISNYGTVHWVTK